MRSARGHSRLVCAEQRTRGDTEYERQEDDDARDAPEHVRSHHDFLDTRSPREHATARCPRPSRQSRFHAAGRRRQVDRDDTRLAHRDRKGVALRQGRSEKIHRALMCIARVESAPSTTAPEDSALTAPQACPNSGPLHRPRRRRQPLPALRAVPPGRGSPRSPRRSPAPRDSRRIRHADRRRTSTAAP